MALFNKQEETIPTKDLYICELGVVYEVIPKVVARSRSINKYIIGRKDLIFRDRYEDIFTGTTYNIPSDIQGEICIFKSTPIISDYEKVPVSLLVQALQSLNPMLFSSKEIETHHKLDIKSLKLGTLKYEK